MLNRLFILLLVVLLSGCAIQKDFVASGEGGVTMKGHCSRLPWNVVKFKKNGVFYFVSYDRDNSLILIDIKHPDKNKVTLENTLVKVSTNNKDAKSLTIDMVETNTAPYYPFRTRHCMDGLLWQKLLNEECNDVKHFRYTTRHSAALTPQIEKLGQIKIDVPAILIDGKRFQPKPVHVKNEITIRGICVL